jgi:hypothetical protein
LLKKGVFIIIINRDVLKGVFIIIINKNVLKGVYIFNLYFINEIKHFKTNKAFKKLRLII